MAGSWSSGTGATGKHGVKQAAAAAYCDTTGDETHYGRLANTATAAERVTTKGFDQKQATVGP